MFNKNDVVTIFNRTPTGQSIIEGKAVILEPTGREGEYRVRFIGDRPGDPHYAGVRRYVDPDGQNDPEAYLIKLQSTS
jgi:hypothetical protein